MERRGRAQSPAEFFDVPRTLSSLCTLYLSEMRIVRGEDHAEITIRGITREDGGGEKPGPWMGARVLTSPI